MLIAEKIVNLLRHTQEHGRNVPTNTIEKTKSDYEDSNIYLNLGAPR